MTSTTAVKTSGRTDTSAGNKGGAYRDEHGCGYSQATGDIDGNNKRWLDKPGEWLKYTVLRA
jgi:hypothetical protein